MTADHFLPVPYGGQVVDLVPLLQQYEILKKLVPLPATQRKTHLCCSICEAQVQFRLRSPRHQCRHVANLSGVGTPRFRWTSSNEIAAGVIPEMREAWPIVSGLCGFSFCCTPITRPTRLRQSNSRGAP